MKSVLFALFAFSLGVVGGCGGDSGIDVTLCKKVCEREKTDCSSSDDCAATCEAQDKADKCSSEFDDLYKCQDGVADKAKFCASILDSCKTQFEALAKCGGE